MRKIFIDGGANIGQSVLVFYSKWEDASEYEIHSFEPNIILRESFLKNTKNFKNITLHNKAISDIDSEEDFYIDTSAGAYGSSLEANKVSSKKIIKVKTINLSKWIIDNFSMDDYIILKLDIEGSEYKVLKHLFDTNTIKYINKVYFESHSHKLKLNEELKNTVDSLIKNCTTTEIYTNTHKHLKFT